MLGNACFPDSDALSASQNSKLFLSYVSQAFVRPCLDHHYQISWHNRDQSALQHLLLLSLCSSDLKMAVSTALKNFMEFRAALESMQIRKMHPKKIMSEESVTLKKRNPEIKKEKQTNKQNKQKNN